MLVVPSLLALIQILLLTSLAHSQNTLIVRSQSNVLRELQSINNETEINGTESNQTGITESANFFDGILDSISSAFDDFVETAEESFEDLWTLTADLIPFIPGPPTSEPSVAPSVVPSFFPTVVPTSGPSSQPSLNPSSIPSIFPTAKPTSIPSVGPTSQPSSSPTSKPSPIPTVLPSSIPSLLPSLTPSVSSMPTNSSLPSLEPSSSPSSSPSVSMIPTASNIPSFLPSISMIPSSSPTTPPTALSSNKPSTTPPVNMPSTAPSSGPTTPPTTLPTNIPSTAPLPSVLDILNSESVFSTFASIVTDSTLEDSVANMEDITIFVPSNGAFQKLPNVDQVLENDRNFNTLINNHIVDGVYPSTELKKNLVLPSLSEDYKITVTLGMGEKLVNGASLLEVITAQNGLVYKIDLVLL